jgi:hypothetical protein
MIRVYTAFDGLDKVDIDDYEMGGETMKRKYAI